MSLRRERHDAVEVWTIDRPDEGNSLNRDLLMALDAAVKEVEGRDDVLSVVLTGAGERIFCAGMDLEAFARGEMEDLDISTFLRLLRGEVATPVVAAVNGAAVAGGFELMLGCDLVVAAEHARFGLPEVKRGLFAPMASTALPGRIPLPIALELGLTGEPIDARRASSLGLVNRVVPAAELLDTALALAAAVSANGPLSVAATKRVMRLAAGEGPQRARAEADAAQPLVFGSADAREGAAAYAAKRQPRWSGR